MYEIERNIPIPEPRGSKAKYPFREMEVGDSIFIIAPVSYSEVYSAVLQASKTSGYKFVMRAVDGGRRVWRVA